MIALNHFLFDKLASRMSALNYLYLQSLINGGKNRLSLKSLNKFIQARNYPTFKFNFKQIL